MIKVGICGHFGIGHNLINGQTIKTKIIAEELKQIFGDDNVGILDTYGGLFAVPRMGIELIKMFARCENIIILPAYKGIHFFVPLCSLLNKLYHRKIHYIVIGGWLEDYIKKNKLTARCLHNFSSINVETKHMKETIEALNYKNIRIMPNCKKLKPVINNQQWKPMKLCTLSRIMKEKGIEDIVDVVTKINTETNKEILSLDIYGEVWPTYKERFDNLSKRFPKYITFKGTIDFSKTVECLKNYSILVFPTKLNETEGFPGAIIDAYAAGLPVVASRWRTFSDVINEGQTGFGYTMNNNDELKNILMEIYQNSNCLSEMKKNCLAKYYEFDATNVVRKFVDDCL